jgi:hypothetical protein
VPLSFDSTGFQPRDQGAWLHPATNDVVTLQYFDLVPDLPAALTDLPKLRHDMTLMHGQQGCLLEAYVVDFGGVPALLRLIKTPFPDQRTGLWFSAVFTVPKATCSANLQIICDEGPVTGFRETMVTTQVGFENGVRPHPYVPGFTGKLQYLVADDPQWDPQFPDHPLSRARAWIRHVLRTAQVDPRFAALPPFEPAPPPAQAPVQASRPSQDPPVAPGSRLHTVVAGIPVGGYLPFWLDNETAAYWRIDDPDALLGRLGHGSIGRSELEDDWRRECLLFDLDGKTLFMADRFKTDDGGIGLTQVAGRLAEFDEARAAVTPAAKEAAFRWVGEAFVGAAERGEHVLVGPGGTQMYRTPRVIMIVLEGESERVSAIQASPVPVGAEVWRDRQPDPGEDTQFLSTPVITPGDIVAGGVLAGYAAETWGTHPLHLAVSFKQTP